MPGPLVPVKRELLVPGILKADAAPDRRLSPARSAQNEFTLHVRDPAPSSPGSPATRGWGRLPVLVSLLPRVISDGPVKRGAEPSATHSEQVP